MREMNPSLPGGAIRPLTGVASQLSAPAARGVAAGTALGEVVLWASRRVRAVARLVGRWQRRRATLRTLAELDATTLRDIGVDPSEVGSVAAELGGHVAASRRRTELDHFLSASSRLRVSRVDACL